MAAKKTPMKPMGKPMGGNMACAACGGSGRKGGKACASCGGSGKR